MRVLLRLGSGCVLTVLVGVWGAWGSGVVEAAAPRTQAQEKKKAKPNPDGEAPRVEFLRLPPTRTLSGTADVRIRVTPVKREVVAVHVCLGGAPWVKAGRVSRRNLFRARLDTTRYPNGPTRLHARVWLARGKPRDVHAAEPVTLENEVKFFFGDLHGHTSYSDGRLLPADAHRHARDVARLDFFVLTDHLEQVDSLEWADTRETAFKANEDGSFVSLPGLEWTKKAGHLNLFDPPSVTWPKDVEGMYRAAAEAQVLGMFNHPGDGATVFGGLAYSEVGDRAMQLMEVRNEKEQQAFVRALDAGWHIAPAGTSDTHRADWGLSGSWTAVVAPGLTRRTVLHALRNRHCYSTNDRNCRLRFDVNGRPMGDVLPQPVNRVAFRIAVFDPDDGDRIALIELFEDGKPVRADRPDATRRVWTPKPRLRPGRHYYFVKVTQHDGQKLWSAPIWLTIQPSV